MQELKLIDPGEATDYYDRAYSDGSDYGKESRYSDGLYPEKDLVECLKPDDEFNWCSPQFERAENLYEWDQAIKRAINEGRKIGCIPSEKDCTAVPYRRYEHQLASDCTKKTALGNTAVCDKYDAKGKRLTDATQMMSPMWWSGSGRCSSDGVGDDWGWRHYFKVSPHF